MKPRSAILAKCHLLSNLKKMSQNVTSGKKRGKKVVWVCKCFKAAKFQILSLFKL